MVKARREDFPLLAKHPSLVYLDSACTSLKPRQVVEAEASFYYEFGACGGRSSHALGRKTSEMVERSRESVAGFVGAEAGGLAWTKNATEALNLVISGLDYSKRRRVVTTRMEHHAVLLPLMRLRDRGIIDLAFAENSPDGIVGEEAWKSAVGKGCALVVTNNGSNTVGAGQSARGLARIVHDAGALLCIDGAQGVPHKRVDFRGDGMDFLCFSAHKMLGPTGIGALAMRPDRMGELAPMVLGGGTVRTVAIDRAVMLENHERFEAGVQHYSGMAGFAEACRYLKGIGMESVERHERELAASMRKELESAGAEIYGPKERGAALISFNIRGAKAHDIALMLDREGIAVRSGFFCAQPAMEGMGAGQGAVRASGYVYNDSKDMERLGEALRKIRQVFE